MARSLIAQLASRYGTPRTAQDRRDFLKATLAASGLTLVSGDTMADAAQKIVRLVA